MIPTARLAGLKSTLERAERPLLVSHVKPDGDTIGSAIGLGLILEGLGKTVQYVCTDPIPEHYQFLDRTAAFRSEPTGDYDLVVMLDCPTDEKTGLDIQSLKAPLVDIDHHPKATRPATSRLAIYDAEASSTAEIVFAAIQYAGWKLERDAATALLTGVITDTSAFLNQATTVQAYRAASELLRRGARHKQIIKHCFFTSSIPKLRLWGLAMSRIAQGQTGGIVATVLTAADVAECGAHPDDVEGLVNFLNSIPGVPALMLLTDLGRGQVKGSLRTHSGSIDVSRLARLLGGGGHRAAAGFSIPGRLLRNPDDSWKVAPAPELAETTG